jgi:hypothetical protein
MGNVQHSISIISIISNSINVVSQTFREHYKDSHKMGWIWNSEKEIRTARRNEYRMNKKKHHFPTFRIFLIHAGKQDPSLMDGKELWSHHYLNI